MKKAINALNSKTSSVEVQKDAKTTNQNHFFPTTETQYHLQTSPYTERIDPLFSANYPSMLRPIPSPIMSFHSPMTTHFNHPAGSSEQHSKYLSSSSEQHSKYLSSSSGMDLTDPADDYVPPLPPPIITSSFSSNHDEDNMEDDAVEVTSSDEDSGINLIVSRSPLKQNNNKGRSFKKKSGEKQRQKINEKIYPITEVFNPLFLDEKKKESSSRPNFATILVQNFFKRESG